MDHVLRHQTPASSAASSHSAALRWAAAAIAVALSLCVSGAASGQTCNATATGNWSSGSTWSCGSAPGIGATATIGSGITVTVDAPVTVSNVTLAGGTITGPAVLTIDATMSWTSGTLGDVGSTGGTVIQPGRTLAISTTGVKNLNKWTIDNSGTVNSTDAWTMAIANGASIVNNGTFNVGEGKYVYADVGALPTFTNNGNVNINTSTPTELAFAFTNAGPLIAAAGTCTFSRGLAQMGSGVLAYPISSLAGYGRIDVPGGITLAGALDVTLLGGYLPAPGDVFTILTYGSVGGAFTTKSLTYTGGRFADTAGPTAMTLTAVAAPVLTSVNPPSGPPTGGTPVTINGNFFTAGPSFNVIFGGAPVTASVTSPTTITCTTPPGAPGPVDVIVSNGDGQTATLPGGFTYVAEADLQVMQTDTLDPSGTDRLVGHTISVMNNGPSDATGVVLTATMPPGSTANASALPPACVLSAPTITCSLGTMLPGPAGSITVELWYRNGPTPGTTSHVVSVAAAEFDPNPANNSSAEPNSVIGPVTFTVNSTADNPDAAPGNAICADAGGACTLRAAIQEANNAVPNVNIILSAGTYQLMIPGAGEDLAATGDLDISHTVFITGAGAANTTIAGNGGDRVFDVIGGDPHQTDDLNLTNLTVTGGSAPDAGGGIRATFGGVITHGVTITGNGAPEGGGIYTFQSGWIDLIDTTISNNTTLGYGGGVHLNSNYWTFMTRCTLSGNTAANGAGVHVGDGILVLDQSTVSGNNASADGGGVKVLSPGRCHATNDTISGNTAGGNGGGIYASTSELTIDSLTIAMNNAGTGGGIYNGGAGGVTMQNSIVAANNTGGNCSGPLNSNGWNLSSDATCPFGAAGDRNAILPLLGPLQNNGGLTLTHALEPASPAIDAGSTPLAIDQRGSVRPRDGNGDGSSLPDIGAFELTSAYTTTVVTTSPNPSVVGQSVTLQASVTPSAATGTVEFFDGGVSLGTSPIAAMVATKVLSSFAAGPHTITAAYGGDSNFQPSTSTGVAHDVKIATAITLASAPNPSLEGQSVNLTATITPADAPGSITFLDGATNLGTATIAGGTASIAATLAAGAHSIQASYPGTTLHAPSTSNTVAQDVVSCPGTIAISAPLSLCPGGSGTASATFVGGATYVWNAANGTITAGQGTASITFTAGSGGNVDLSVSINGCGPSAWVAVGIAANATITAPASVCVNSGGNTASVPAQSGASYSWSIGSGTITAGQGTPTITFTAGAIPGVGINVTVTTACGSNNGGTYVETDPPTQIHSPGVICANSSSNTADVRLVSGATYSWSIANGTITSGATTNAITYSVGTASPVTLTVTSSGGSCGGTATNSFDIAVGTPRINTTDRVCAGVGNVHASADWAGGGATYAWTITNGTITTSPTADWVSFTPGASGAVDLTVTISGMSCGTLTTTKTIPIDSPVPALSITAPLSVCPGGSATASVNSVPGAVYNWNVNGATFTGQGTDTITFTAGPSGNVDLWVGVNNACGGATAGLQVGIAANATITAPESVCVNSGGNTASVPAQSGASYSWSINCGTITAGQGTPSITFSAGACAGVNVNVNVTTACGSNGGGAFVETDPPSQIHSPGVICANSTGNAADVRLVSGTTYSWSIANGTITSGAATNAITYSVGTATPVTLTVTSTGGTCGGTRTNSFDVAVGAPRIYTVDRVCATATNVRANADWTGGATYTWTITNGTITTSPVGGWVDFNPGASGAVGLTVTITGLSCGTLTNTKTIPIDTPLPALAVTAPLSVCPGGSDTATVTAVPGASYNWTISNGTITAGQGSGSITFQAGTGGNVDLWVSVGNGCGSGTANASVGIAANASITASQPVCINSGGHTASVPVQSGATYNWSINCGTITAGQGTPAITFSNAACNGFSVNVSVTTGCGTNNGSLYIETSPPTNHRGPQFVCANTTGNISSVLFEAGTSYSWSITNGTILSGANTNEITYAVGTATPATLNITSTNTCGTMTNAINIDVGTPQIYTSARVCSTSTNVGANTGWAAGATYAWTISGGTLTTAPNNPWVNFNPAPSGNVVLSVTISGLACGPLTATKTIPIDPPVGAFSINAPLSLCPGTSGTATATAVAGAVYSWTIANGTITGGQGTQSVTFTAGSNGNVDLWVSTDNACSGLNAHANVGIGANSVITAPATVCVSSGGHTASVVPQSGATYSWWINGGTITAGQGTSAITFSVGAVSYVDLGVTVTTACGSNGRGTRIDTNPLTNIKQGPQIVCPNSSGNLASVMLESGTSYAWSITGGTITGGATTNEVTYSAGPTGPITLSLTATGACGTSTGTRLVDVGETRIWGPPDRICSTSTNVNAWTDWSPGATYSWSITGGTIVSATNQTQIQFNPGPTGSVVLTATVSGIGCGPYTATKTIAIDPPVGSVAITAPAVVCGGSSGNAASITSPVAGALYTWSISNGTIDSGQGTSSINFTAAAGFRFVHLSVSTGSGCGGSITSNVSVPINAITTITAPSSVCFNSAGNTASVPVQNGATYAWTIDIGTITAGQGTNAITFTAGAAQWVNLGVTVTTACGSAGGSVGIPTSPTTQIRGPQLACANSSNIASTPLETGTTYNWSITNGTITAGLGTNQITYSVGTATPVMITLTSTGSCGTNSSTTQVDVGTSRIWTSSGDRVCATSTNVRAWTPWVQGATYAWSITGGTITSNPGPNTQWVDFTPAPAGSVVLTATISGLACGPYTATKTLPIDAAPLSAVSISAPDYLCSGTSGTATASPAGNGSYNWWIDNGTITAGQGTDTITFTVGSSGTSNLYLSVNNGCGGSANTGRAVGINAGTIVSQQLICINSTGNVASIVAPADSTYSWSISNGTITAGQGTSSIVFTAGGTPRVNVNVSVTNSCGSEFRGLGINTSPATWISSPTILCPGGSYVASVPSESGTTWTWSMTNGTITTGQGTSSITFTPAAAGPLQLSVSATGTCGSNSNTLALNVGSITFTGPSRVCAGQNANAGAGSAPGATYSWTISGGTITSGATSSNVYYTAGMSGSVILGVTVGGLSCGPLTASRTVPIDDPAGTLTITAPSVACPDSTGNSATATAIAGVTYNWSIAQEVFVTSPAAIAAAYYANPASFGPLASTTGVTGELVLGLDAADTAGPSTTDACSPLTNVVTGKIVVVDRGTCGFTVKVKNAQNAGAIGVIVVDNVTPGPAAMGGTDATITIPAVSMSLENGALLKPYLPFTATVRATGTITAGQGTNAITFTAGKPGTSVGLSVFVARACGAQSAANSVRVTPGDPYADINVPVVACAGSSVTASCLENTAGDSYVWTVTNGTITAGQGTGSVTFTAGASGMIAVYVQRTTACGLTSYGVANSAINGAAPISIGGPNGICAGASGTASANNAPAGSTYSWTITNGTITSATNVSPITFVAGPTGDVIVEATVTACGNTMVGRRVVPINPALAPVINASPVCPNSRDNFAGTPRVPGATYAWSIANGTITSGTTANNIWFTAGPSGTVGLTVTVTFCGVSASTTYDVPVDSVTDLHLAAYNALCPNSTGNFAYVDGTWPDTAAFSWSIVNGTITSGASSQVITYTAGASGIVTLTSTVTSCSQSRSASINAAIGVVPSLTLSANSTVCASSAGNVATVASAGPESTYAWSIVNGTITTPANVPRIEYTAGSSGSVELIAVVTSCIGPQTVRRTVPIASPAALYISVMNGLCPNTNGNSASISPPYGSQVSWTISNGFITSGTTANSVTFSTLGAGTVSLAASVTVCGTTTTVTKDVPVGAPPTSTIIAYDPAVTSPTLQVASVAPGGRYNANTAWYAYAGRPGTYQWSISNGTLIDNPNDPVIAFIAGTSGSVTLSVTITTCGGTSTNSVVLPIVIANATITAPPFVCAGSATNTATAAVQSGATYTWSITNGTIMSGNGTSSITFAAGLTGAVGLSLSVSAVGAAPATSSVSIPITTATAAITASGPTTFCQGGSVTLTASPGTAYQWFESGAPIAGAIAATWVATATGSYSVQVTSGGCVATSAAVPVTVNLLPTAIVTTSGPITFCSGGSVTLTASPGTTYQWLSSGTPIAGATGSSYIASASGSYTVSITNAAGCASTSAPTVITVTSAPVVSIIGPASVCPGTQVTLDAGAGFSSYLWSTGETTQTIVVTPLTATTYSVTVADIGGCTASGSTTINVSSASVATITADGPLTFCEGLGSVVLTASAGSLYQWYRDGQAITAATSQSIRVTLSGSYTVEVTLGSCKGISAATVVTASPAPNTIVTSSGPASFCSGGSVTLSVAPGNSYQWLNNFQPIAGAISSAYTVTATGNYSVQVTSAEGCSSTSIITAITVNPSPGVTITGPATSCTGGSVTLDAGPGYTSYLWSTGEQTQAITVSPALTTSYSVTVANSTGCTATASQTVTVGTAPAATITAPPNVCSGSTGNVAAVAPVSGATYNWTITGGTIVAGAGTERITFTAGASGNVVIGVSIASGGCVATGSATVGISEASAAITAPAGVCAGSTTNVATVPAQSNATYTWTITGGTITAGAGTNSITFTADASGSVSLGVTVASAACSTSGSVAIPIAPQPVLRISGPSTACPGSSITLDAGSGFNSYLWSNGATTQTITESPAATTTYSVTVRTVAGCSASASTTVTVTAGTATVIAAPATVCSNSESNSASVPAATGATYLWTMTGGTITAGQGTSAIAFTAGASGSVVVGVTVTSAACGGSASQTIPIVLAPAVAISGPAAACSGIPVVLDAGAGYESYAWSTGATTQSIAVVPAATTTYTVTVASGGCSARASHTLAVTQAIVPQISAPASLCGSATGNTASVAPIAGATYSWTIAGGTITSGFGSSSITFDAGTAGSVTLGVTVSVSGCSGSASTTIPITPVVAKIIGPSTVCPGSTVTLDAGAGFTSYLWSTGATTQTIVATPTATTVYSVIVTGGAGCSASGTRTVTVTTTPAVNIIMPTGVCADSAANVASIAAAPGATYAWTITGGTITSGSGTNQIAFTAASSGSVVVGVTLTSSGCTSSGMASADIISRAAATIAVAPTVCALSMANIAAVGAVDGATYTWTIAGGTIVGGAGSNRVTFAAAASGSIVLGVTVTRGGCSSTGSSIVAISAPVAASISGPATVCAGSSITLDAGGGFASYTWSTGATTQSITVSPTVMTQYLVTVANAAGCTATATRTIAVSQTAPASIAAPPSVCAASTSNSASVAPQSGATYTWTITGGTITAGAGTNSITFTAGDSGSVALGVTVSAGGCSGTANTTVSIAPVVTPRISGPATACAGSSVTLDAGSGYSGYLWSTGATTQTITVAPAATTTYSVTVQSGSSCGGSASHTITVTAAAAPAIAVAASVCANSTSNTAAVPATAGATYAWTVTGGTITSGQGTPTILFTAGASGSVALGVTVTSASCGGTATQTVPIVAPPTVTITGPTSTCSGSPVTLDAGAGYQSYLWSNGANAQTITVSPSSDTTYSVTVTTAAGCSASASQTVTVSAPPSATITIAPATILASSTSNTASVATGPSGTTYAWSITGGTITSGAGTSKITFTAAQGGSISIAVTVTTPAGCKATGSASVAIQSSADLALAMTGSGNAINNNGTLTYTIVVTNSGPSPAANVSVAISTRGGSTIASATGSGWTCISGGTTATCTVATAPAGSLPPITVKVTAPGTVGSISTSATVSSASTDPTTTNNVATLTASVTGPLCSTTAPQLTAPAEGAASLSSPITFSWTAVPNATAYELWLGTDGGAPALVGTVTSTSTSATVSGKSGTWYIGAQLGTECPTLYSARRSFTIYQPPACDHPLPVGTAPQAQSTQTSPVTFTWNAVPEAIGYRVWIMVDGGAPQDVGATDATKTSLQATVTAGAITWYVEAQFSGCPLTTSVPIAFTVPKPDPCASHAAPSLIAPSDGATTTSSIEFHWVAAADASGYRVWGKIDEAAAAVLGTAGATDVSLTAKIASGHVEWWVESLYDGCPSRESDHRTFDVPKAIVCGTDVPALVTPSEAMAVSERSVVFGWTAAAQATGYEVWLSLAGGTPSLAARTSSTSLVLDVPQGTIEWFVRATFEGCPTRDSGKGHVTYTPPPACTDVRPLLNSPANNATGVYSPVEFTWKEVPGAISYRLWATRGNAVDVIGTTTVPSLSNIAIPPGRIEWYVQAMFGGDCPSTSSSPSRFVVAPTPPPCSAPEQPVIIAESTASSGTQYMIHWSGVAPGNNSMLQESLTGYFDDAGVVNTTENAYAFLHVNKSNNPITYYYRVRAIGRCSGELQLGPYSTVAVVVILPDKPQAGQLQGSTPADTAQSITYTIPIPSDYAGLAFTATPNETWLTVTPSSGVVPVGGLNLTVVANTTGLPVGTTLGGITITTRPVTASGNRSETEATTTINTTVSVNLVQPILPTPKNTPPPDALIIPAVSHADGINSKFQSDVRLTNTSAQVMKYQVTFTPSGDEGLKQSKQTSVDVSAGQTLALDDVLGTWFNSGAFKNLIGTLEIRPLTQVSSSTSSVTSAGLQNVVSFASSRTFAATANGSYGQYVPAIPFANFIGKGASTLSLQQIAQSAAYRTNLGLVEGSGQAATAVVSVFGTNGSKLTDFNVNLNGGQHVQLNGFLQQKGIELSDGRVEVKVTSPNGKVTAYASVLDNRTNDPLLVTPMAIGLGGGSKYVLPGVADLVSAFANWRTDMRIFNAASTPVDATLTFYSQYSTEPPRTAEVSFAAGEVKQFDAVVSSLFGATNNGGALHITTAAASNLVATGRTYNQTTAGTYGQFVGAVTLADAIALGSRPLQILQVEESTRFRSNVGLAEIAGKPAKLQVSIIPPDGRTTAVFEVNLAANEFRQFTSLLKEIGLTNVYNARVSVKVTGGEGRVTAYASVIDSMTQDPTYVPAQ